MFVKFLLTACILAFVSVLSEMMRCQKPWDSSFHYSKCRCGTRAQNISFDMEDLIVGGEVVDPPYKYPWMVSIIKSGETTCGATLISRSFILSAAHCFVKRNILHALDSGHETCLLTSGKGSCFYPFSEFTADIKGRLNNMKHVRFRKIIIHPEYSLKSKEYDIALIQLRRPVRCSAFTQPICLPCRVPQISAGSKAIITGRGRTLVTVLGSPSYEESKLMEAHVKILPQQECRRFNPTLTHICAKGYEEGACMGDSGGPLMAAVGRRFYVFGVISHALSKACDPEDPQFYTNVKLVLDWIRWHLEA